VERKPAVGQDFSEVRSRLLEQLQRHGYQVSNGCLLPPPASSKEAIRQLHAPQRQTILERLHSWIVAHEPKLLPYFADGSEVQPDRIYPRLEPVNTPLKAALFRYASLTWSVPVSNGYGRRMRFLVFDASNDKLMGLLALGDPVYNLRVRDQWIGWSVEQKNARLWHVMDAYVLGSVPPYNHLLCGKLIALLATSEEVRGYFRARYAGRASVIRGQHRPPHLALITTTSALGRSSLYNRLVWNGRRVFLSVGFTEGWGHFHFANGLFEELRTLLRLYGDPEAERHAYGQGPNWRFRVIRKGLARLGLSGDCLRHGVRREVFVAPLGENAREFLRGETEDLRYYAGDMASMFAYFRERWLLPRAERNTCWRQVRREHLRLSRQLQH
jgi:hypothetical protein